MASILIILPEEAEKSILLVGEYLTEKGYKIKYVPDDIAVVTEVISSQFFDYTIVLFSQYENVKIITAHIRNRMARSLCILILCITKFSVFQLIEFYASGFLLENFCLSDMLLCINTLKRGEKYLSQDIRELMTQNSQHDEQPGPCDLLSQRETSILTLLAKGKKSKQIADELCISINTLHNHKTNIRNKLNLNSNREILFLAIRQSNKLRN